MSFQLNMFTFKHILKVGCHFNLQTCTMARMGHCKHKKMSMQVYKTSVEIEKKLTANKKKCRCKH